MLHLPQIGAVGHQEGGSLVLYIGTCQQQLRGKQRSVSPDTEFSDHWRSRHCLTQSIMLEDPNLCPECILDATGSPTTTKASSSAPSTTSLSSSSTSSPVVVGGGSKAWIAGAVIGPVVGLGFCAAAYWLWRRRRNHHDRKVITERKAHDQIADTQQIGPQSEHLGEHAATPFMLHEDSAPRFMLHADSAQKSHELP